MAKYLFTSESVTEGHPDKICDQISDAVLDAILEQDPDGRVACETAVTTGMVLVMGEISTKCYVDIPKIAREVIRDIDGATGVIQITGDWTATDGNAAQTVPIIAGHGKFAAYGWDAVPVIPAYIFLRGP